MNKDKYLTVSWNNILLLVMGIPAVIYGGIALYNDLSSSLAGFIGIIVIGAVY